MHRRALLLLLLFVVAVAAVPAFGTHAWGTYHWSKPGAQVAAPVTMNVSGPWANHAARVMADWNLSTVIESPWSFGSISSAKRCTSATGKIEVCNSTYGQTGWLGIAGVTLSGGHIVKSYTKLNDTYYNTGTYNTPEWRQLVMCQEVGHGYGLGHQDENFNNVNLGSCMDYTNAPAGGVVNGFDYGPSNLYPNAHDYAQLLIIYNHSDATLPFDALTADATRPRRLEEVMANAGQWGTPVAFNDEGLPVVFFLKTGTNHEGNDEGNLLHVFWAPEDPFANTRGPGHGHEQ